jgi:hypothetical protein
VSEKCGCRVSECELGGHLGHIKYCPLHRSAEKLLEACEKFTELYWRRSAGIDVGYSEAIDMAEAAKAAAKGEK